MSSGMTTLSIAFSRTTQPPVSHRDATGREVDYEARTMTLATLARNAVLEYIATRYSKPKGLKLIMSGVYI